MLHPNFDIDAYLDGAATETPQRLGSRGQTCVAALLQRYGFIVRHMEYISPFDLMVDNARVEVKCAVPSWERAVPSWQFNIHRHGRVSEANTDLYILRLESVPFFKAAIHLLFEAPLGKATVTVSLRGLLGTYARNSVAFREFCADKQKRFNAGERVEIIKTPADLIEEMVDRRVAESQARIAARSETQDAQNLTLKA